MKNHKGNDVRIYSDQTPYQQKYLENLRRKLQERQENGEKDLFIKYKNGTPTIIKIHPKN